MEIAISDAEIELLHDLNIFHDVQGIEHVITLVSRQDQSVSHQLDHVVLAGHIVVRISYIQNLVLWMFQNARGQRVETDKIGNLLVSILDYV